MAGEKVQIYNLFILVAEAASFVKTLEFGISIRSELSKGKCAKKEVALRLRNALDDFSWVQPKVNRKMVEVPIEVPSCKRHEALKQPLRHSKGHLHREWTRRREKT